MKKEPYSWWDDPKNKDEVYKISWWEHPENKETFDFPISVIEEDGQWCAGTNKESEELLGYNGHGVGNTKEEAIKDLFKSLRFFVDYLDDRQRNYQRFVPFRSGKWKGQATHWFVVFGIHFYFRYGDGMLGGKYIPFTKLNVTVHNEWKQYKEWKKKKHEEWYWVKIIKEADESK